MNNKFELKFHALKSMKSTYENSSTIELYSIQLLC